LHRRVGFVWPVYCKVCAEEIMVLPQGTGCHLSCVIIGLPLDKEYRIGGLAENQSQMHMAGDFHVVSISNIQSRLDA